MEHNVLTLKDRSHTASFEPANIKPAPCSYAREGSHLDEAVRAGYPAAFSSKRPELVQ